MQGSQLGAWAWACQLGPLQAAGGELPTFLSQHGHQPPPLLPPTWLLPSPHTQLPAPQPRAAEISNGPDNNSKGNNSNSTGCQWSWAQNHSVGLRETPGSHLCPLSCPSPLTPSCRPGGHAHYTDSHLRPGAESLSPWDTEAQQVYRVTGDQPPPPRPPSGRGILFRRACRWLPAGHSCSTCLLFPALKLHTCSSSRRS